jgi:hypothetical protein
MFEFERPYVRRLAELLLGRVPEQMRVLDIGVGASIFMTEVLKLGPACYVGLEVNRALVQHAHSLVESVRCPHTDVTLVGLPWQRYAMGAPSLSDAVLLDTYPPDGFGEHDFEHFVAKLPLLLAPNGSLGFIRIGGKRENLSRDALVGGLFEGTTWITSEAEVPPNWPHDSSEVTFHAYFGFVGPIT